jgi:DNA-binding response OmpR family regulator
MRERMAPECQTFMALILCAGLDPALMQTRRMILQRAGHKVIGAGDEREFVAACQSHTFHVILLSQTLPSVLKLRLSAIARMLRPEAKILELYASHLGRAIRGADDWLEVPLDSPGDLVSRIELLLSRHDRAAGAGSSIL